MGVENGNLMFFTTFCWSALRKNLQVASFVERSVQSPVKQKGSAKRNKLKVNSIFLIFFNVLFEEVATG